MSTARTPRSTLATCVAALACSILAVIAAVTPLPPTVRGPIMLLFCCWVPGVALFAGVRAWQLVRSPAATIAVSLSLLVLISQVALALHLWAPAVGTTVIAAVSLVALIPAVVRLRPTGLHA